MPDAIEVARYLLKLAAEEPEPEYLSHMRLQKLLYYVQGWCLGVRGRPMFDSPIEAWRHGPVVRDVFAHFADHGDGPIPFSRAGTGEALSRSDREFIVSIWETYKPLSGAALRQQTHAEAPWQEAWGDRDADDRCDEEITQDAMTRHFEQEYRRRQLPGFELERLRKSDVAFREGRGVPLKQAFSGLGHDAV